MGAAAAAVVVEGTRRVVTAIIRQGGRAVSVNAVTAAVVARTLPTTSVFRTNVRRDPVFEKKVRSSIHESPCSDSHPFSKKKKKPIWNRSKVTPLSIFIVFSFVSRPRL